ncbi:O-antigen ligase family protein [Vibrio europaeus]|uniref:O-antigen ligase family protein n=1 Tax=Vibrio europaeus TaxID=300876 RepID=A0A178J5I3_9VIBR|nr:O-antigen ligase family protein [Vibrio europaeus]MDC5705778.1 O-antigen ligase family protein [Vibrio europaeus]MDC5709188.1 O-antigen ligase family protein [Vibrio europaeus]MDC5713587.1 O-antigen ligase family protein [Vibrio europaeus]MDC5720307.1 O-antigen ligase family protein [Vibrio europaeus]MDC5723806.1 O-antigen ligase family protein [Vibrio europaeus]
MSAMFQSESQITRGNRGGVHSFVIARSFLMVIAIGLMLFSFNLFIPRWEVLFLYDSKRMFVCAMVVGCALMYLLSYNLRRDAIVMLSELSTPVKVALAIFAVAMSLANSLGEHFIAAFVQQFYFVGLILLALVLTPYVSGNKPQLLRLYALMNLLLFFSVAIMFWGVTLTGNSVSIFTIFGFVNPRFLNHMQVWSVLPVAYIAVIGMQRQHKAILPRLILALIFATSFATDARGALLSMSMGFALLMTLDVSRRRHWWTLLWQSLITGFLVKYALLAPFPQYVFGDTSLLAPEIRTTSSGRLELWLDLLANVNWLGHGGDKYACEGLVVAGPHNSFLNVLYHWGIAAFAAYSLLIALLLNKLKRIHHKATLVAGVSVSVGIGYSVLSGVLVTPLSQLLAVCNLALFWGLRCRHSGGKEHSIKPNKLSHLLLAVSCILTITLVSYRVSLRVEHYPTLDQETVYKPQFWLGYNCLTSPQLP